MSAGGTTNTTEGTRNHGDNGARLRADAWCEHFAMAIDQDRDEGGIVTVVAK